MMLMLACPSALAQSDSIVVHPAKEHRLATLRVGGHRSWSSTTANVAGLSAEKLAVLQHQTLAGALATLPGVRMLSSGGMIQKPIVDGMANSRIVVIDNDMKLAGQHWADDHAPELSLWSFAQAYVEKGAMSVKYGANALGGAVVVRTPLNATMQGSRGSVNVSYNTNGRMYGGEVFFEDRLPVHVPMRYRVAAKYYKSGDRSTADYRLDNTGAEVWDVKVQHAMQLSPRWTWDEEVSLYRAEMGIFSGSHISGTEALLYRFEQGRPSAEELTPFSYRIEAPRQQVTHWKAGVHAAYALREDEHLHLNLGFQHNYRKEYEVRTGDYTRLPTFAFRLSTANLHTHWDKKWKEGHTLEAGADWTYMRNVSDNNTKAVPVIPNYVSHAAGIYAAAQGYVRPALKLEAGVRADYQYVNATGYNSLSRRYGGEKQYASLSAQAGLKWNASPEWSLHTNIGLAWRAPDVNELYSRGLHHGDAVYQIGDERLKTEKALKWTGGATWTRGVLTIQWHAFAQYVYDYIYTTPRYSTDAEGVRRPDVFELLSGAYPIYYFVQSNGIFAGMDLMVHVQLSKNLHYEARGEWMRAKNTDSHLYFPNIPADRYRHGLHYTYDWMQYELSASVHHTFVDKQHHFSPETDLLPDTPPAYHLLGGDVSLSRSLPWGRLTFYATIENALNTLYKDYTNRLRFYAHDMGRSVNMGIRLAF